MAIFTGQTPTHTSTNHAYMIIKFVEKLTSVIGMLVAEMCPPFFLNIDMITLTDK
jgi:hypothetical protein